MSVKLTSDQIPTFWGAIKFAVVNVDNVSEKYRKKYLNRLLYQLLSGKAQCFVRLDEQRQLQAIAITKILEDEITDEKSLFISCLYSFIKVDVRFWQDDIQLLKKYAEKKGCTTVTCWTVSDKVAQLCESVGMRYRMKSFSMNL